MGRKQPAEWLVYFESHQLTSSPTTDSTTGNYLLLKAFKKTISVTNWGRLHPLYIEVGVKSVYNVCIALSISQN